MGIVSSASLAPETPPEPPFSERGRLAKNHLDQKLAVWQQRLELQEWTISVVLSNPRELRGGTLGNVHWNHGKKSAIVRVLDASNYEMSWNSTLSDMEFTLVHELLHLELASLPRSESSRSHEEQAVNNMARALLRLDRKSEPPLKRQPLFRYPD